MHLRYIVLLLISLSILFFSCEENKNNPVNPSETTMAISAPKDGDTMTVGSSFQIKWTCTSTSKVKIEYSTDYGSTWKLIKNDVENTGTYTWFPVPNLETSQGKIRISTSDSIFTVSEGSFKVYKPSNSTLVLGKPNGGELLYVNQSYRIEWVSSEVLNVKIEYSYDNGSTFNVIIGSYPADSGSYLWKPIPNTPSAQCRVKISDASNNSLNSISASTFIIVPPSDLRLTAPNGGEDWLVGTTNEIRWTSVNIDSVKLEYTINGGAQWNTIVDKIPSNGLYNWQVPQTLYRSDLCQIRISEAKNGAPFDLSDNFFSLHPNTKLLRWVFPNGGEFIWQDTLITWISSGITNVNIQFSDDNGVTWNTVANNYHSTGAFYWILPYSLPSTLTRLRIFDSSDSTVTDMSDSYFYLHIKEGINLDKPVISNVGSDMNILWKVSNNINSVKIEYRDEKSSEWHLIADNVPSTYKKTNSYLWRGIPQDRGKIQLRITDTDRKYSSESDVIKIN